MSLSTTAAARPKEMKASIAVVATSTRAAPAAAPPDTEGFTRESCISGLNFLFLPQCLGGRFHIWTTNIGFYSHLRMPSVIHRQLSPSSPRPLRIRSSWGVVKGFGICKAGGVLRAARGQYLGLAASPRG